VHWNWVLSATLASREVSGPRRETGPIASDQCVLVAMTIVQEIYRYERAALLRGAGGNTPPAARAALLSRPCPCCDLHTLIGCMPMQYMLVHKCCHSWSNLCVQVLVHGGIDFICGS